MALRGEGEALLILSASPREVPKPVDGPSGTEYHDPVWLVQRAWSAYRLPGLQAVVRTTIVELQALDPVNVLDGGVVDCSDPEVRRPDPVLEALRACSEELRDASGMAGSHVARAAHCTLVRRYTSQQPAAWGKTFTAALERYRHVACAALLVAFQPEPEVT